MVISTLVMGCLLLEIRAFDK